MTAMNREKILRALNDRMGSSGSLCGLFGIAESEVIIFQTLRASVANSERHGKAFSFLGKGTTDQSGRGLVDNPKGLQALKDRGWIEETSVELPCPSDVLVDEGGRPRILILTDGCLDALAVHLPLAGKEEEKRKGARLHFELLHIGLRGELQGERDRCRGGPRE